MGNHKLKIVYRDIEELIPYVNNARTHSPTQVKRIADSIKEFGWTNPILIDGNNGIVAGHGRVLAAKKLGMRQVPTIELFGLSPTQKRAYILADNRLALDAGWDEDLLKLELTELQELNFDLALTGFSDEEIEELLDMDDEEEPPEGNQSSDTSTKKGEVWIMGAHR